ncbi:MAG: hypothetical protein K5761_05265 [Clostridiales bacterium]|nr:hypothetical protein [Clostridiales bacterium]
MKKIISMTLVVLLIFALAVPAFAAGINSYEQKILDYAATKYVVDGKTITVSDDITAQLKNVFNSDSIDVTEDQYNEIIAILDEGLAYCKSHSITSIEDLQNSDEDTDALLEIGERALAVLGCTAQTEGSIKDADHGLMMIFDADGNKIAEFHPNIKVTEITAKTNPIDVRVIVISVTASVAIIAVAFVCFKKFRKVED